MEEVPKKLSFNKKTRNRLIEMRDKGVTKFCSYDVYGKKVSRDDLDRLRTSLYELCMAGEIAHVKDINGTPKRIRPSDDTLPEWLSFKVMVSQYEIKELGKKKPPEATSWYRRQKALKVKVDKTEKVKSVWETIWPDLYKVPAFKNKQVFTNQCMD